MDNENILCTILLHLPLQVVWRLPGLNHILQRALMNEAVWFERDLREYPMIALGGMKLNHRIHQLVCSNEVYGKLWYGDRAVRSGVYSYHTIYDYGIYLDRTGIRRYRPEADGGHPSSGGTVTFDDHPTVHGDSRDELLVPGVRRMATAASKIYLYWCLMKSGEIRLYQFMRDGTVVDRSDLLNMTIRDAYRVNLYTSDRIVITLTLGGRLYYHSGSTIHYVRDGVVGYCRLIQNATPSIYNLLLMLTDGGMELVRVGTVPLVIVLHKIQGNYIKARYVMGSWYLNRSDGLIDLLTHTGDTLRVTPLKVPVPVRCVIALEGLFKQPVAVGLDGRCFPLVDNVLLRTFPELSLFGLLDYQGTTKPFTCVHSYPNYTT